MNRAANRRPTPRILPALIALTFLALPLHSPAQEAIRAGFTRPGDPSGPQAGKEVGAVDDPARSRTAFGGTVYFLVLERRGDNWDTVVTDFDNRYKPRFETRFKPGIDSGGTSSPDLDRAAKFLYLYQVVNDRRTKAPMESISIRLMVELKEVTSWGSFEGVGFATEDTGGKDKGDRKIRPVSFSHIVDGLGLVYRQRAPAVPVANPYRLVEVPTKHSEKAKGEKGINLVWDALDPASEPDHVMLLSTSDFDKNPAFRAIWAPDNLLKRDSRSTVFGFTSNLPPMTETVRLRGVPVDDKGAPIRPAGGVRPEEVGSDYEVRADQGDRPAGGRPQEDSPRSDNRVRADGQATTPRPASFQTEGAPAPFPIAALPPMSAPPQPALPGPSGAAGSAPTPARGSGAGAAAGQTGGGGFAGGSSGGTTTTSTTSTPTPSVPPTVPPTAPLTQTQTVFFNPTLSNTNTNTNTSTNSNTNQQTQQQAQAQSQAQRQTQRQQQRQRQRQVQDPHVPSAVVPQPAALLLAALGLPVLFFLRRRRKAAS
jgi:hypothetical protein